MNKFVLNAILAASLLPAGAMAQSAFDGTWKVDLGKLELPKKPDAYVLQNGMYECKTCAPAYKVKADGSDQKVSGNPYADMVAVKVVDDHTMMQTSKKGGKVVSTFTFKVAADGKTASFEFNDSSDSNAAPVTGKGSAMRIAAGPAGSHVMSGSWRTTSYENVSDNGLSFTYKMSGDSLSMTTPTGQSYTAKTNGAEAQYKGDPGITSVSIMAMGKNTLQETDKRNGKIIGTSTMTVSADGKSMQIKWRDMLRNTSGSIAATKQ
jgi:hypothetical protein